MGAMPIGDTERFGEIMSNPVPEAPPAQPVAPEPAAPATPAAPPATGELGDGGLKALQAERARAAKAESDLKALQQQIDDSKKTAEQKAADDIAAAQNAAKEASALAARYQVIADKGGDLKFADYLTGSTRDELEAAYDKLMALIPQAPEAPPAPPVGPTVPGQQPGGAPAPAQITRSDLDALAAAGKDGEINRLRREGRLSHLLGGQ